MPDIVGSGYNGNSRYTGKNILANPAGVVHDSATVVLSSSGEFQPGLALRSGGSGDVKVPYANSDTIAEVSGEAILDELIVITDTAGGQQTVKVLVGGNVRTDQITDRDGNAIDADFTGHNDMKNVRFVGNF